MNFLFDNPLATMSGPMFLAFFVVFIIVTLAVLAIAKSNIDKTNRLPVPAIPPQIDPFEIAFLRGGENELARSVIFSLVHKGFLEIVNSDGGSIRRVEGAKDPGSLSAIENIALEWVGQSRTPGEVFSSGGLVGRLSRHNAKYDLDLANRQFLMPGEWRSKARNYGLAAALTIAGLGGYKILAAILGGRYNVMFTVFLIILGCIAALTIARLPRMTKHGKQYISRLQSAFEGLKLTSQAPYLAGANPQAATAQSGSAGIDPLLLSVGVFGTGILAGTMFAGYNDVFARQQASSGSGCGASCGSCSSGDSGCSSGCSSGCGGGCGGCS